MAQKNILKINYALSSQPLYVSVENTDLSMDSIFREAVQSLQNSGRNQESVQLAQLYQEHQIFDNAQNEISKGATFGTLKTTPMVVQDQTVNYAEVTLSTKHVGGC
jgi:hypothetical protein